MAERKHRVSTTLNAKERAALGKVRRFVFGYTGDKTTAEVLRFLVRNWSEDGSDLCRIGHYCREHGHVHGSEAEELRAKLAKLRADDDGNVPGYQIEHLLDDVDARDSLAYLENRPKARTKKKRKAGKK